MLYANSPVPLYRQLYIQLRDEIENQSLPVGQRLPSERDLAAAHGISRLTARRALQLLQQAGYINAQQGRGSFVVGSQMPSAQRLAGSAQIARQWVLTPTNTKLHREVIQCDPELAAQLQALPLSKAIKVQYLRAVEGRPVAFDTCYLPFDLCHQVLTADLEATPLHALLECSLGFRLRQVEQSAEAVIADDKQLEMLELQYPAALLRLRRSTYNEQGRVVEYAEILYCGEQNRLDGQSRPS
jgi:GntR family transcriptional regulator